MRRAILVVLFVSFPMNAICQEKSPKGFDWKFASLTAGQVAATIWDDDQTQGCLKNVVGCRETDWIYGPRPSPVRMYGTSLALDAAFTGLSWTMRHHGPKFVRRAWEGPILFSTGSHIQAIAESVHSGKLEKVDRQGRVK
jgi:hypothetical protein